MISMEMIEIIIPAILIGVFISFTHGLFGIKILKRGIVFIDLAIAQIAGLGLIIANMIFPEHQWSYQFIALFFAISSSLFFYYIEKIAPDIQEAIIGCSFIFAASLSILFLANHAHGGDEIKHLLSGQILFVTMTEVILHAPIYIIITIIWFVKPNFRSGIGFYLCFAILITSSVQLVGVYVVFASLILPAICARNHKSPIIAAWLCGIAAVIMGMIFSIILDLPSGPLLVVSYVLTATIITFYTSNTKHL